MNEDADQILQGPRYRSLTTMTTVIPGIPPSTIALFLSLPPVRISEGNAIFRRDTPISVCLGTPPRTIVDVMENVYTSTPEASSLPLQPRSLCICQSRRILRSWCACRGRGWYEWARRCDRRRSTLEHRAFRGRLGGITC